MNIKTYDRNYIFDKIHALQLIFRYLCVCFWYSRNTQKSRSYASYKNEGKTLNDLYICLTGTANCLSVRPHYPVVINDDMDSLIEIYCHINTTKYQASLANGFWCLASDRSPRWYTKWM